jgi:threonine dehydratase
MKIDLDTLEKAAALVYRMVPPTPQYCWPLLSRRVGTELWVKHENHTPIGAFKIRGGLVYLEEIRRSHPDLRGVVTATTGNHGQSIALAAAQLGMNATIVAFMAIASKRTGRWRRSGHGSSRPDTISKPPTNLRSVWPNAKTCTSFNRTTRYWCAVWRAMG